MRGVVNKSTGDVYHTVFELLQVGMCRKTSNGYSVKTTKPNKVMFAGMSSAS